MLFGSSGIRQRFDRSLVEIALAVGAVMGERYPDRIVGTDTRTTSPVLSRAILAGILGAGGNARFTGIAPTPSVAYSARVAKDRVHDHRLPQPRGVQRDQTVQPGWFLLHAGPAERSRGTPHGSSLGRLAASGNRIFLRCTHAPQKCDSRCSIHRARIPGCHRLREWSRFCPDARSFDGSRGKTGLLLPATPPGGSPVLRNRS